MSAYEYRDKTLNIDALTIADAQFLIREMRKINTMSREDIRPRLRAQVRCLLEEIADGAGDPYKHRRSVAAPLARPEQPRARSTEDNAGSGRPGR